MNKNLKLALGIIAGAVIITAVYLGAEIFAAFAELGWNYK